MYILSRMHVRPVTLVERLKKKETGSGLQKVVGDFVFAVGPYGPYMYKKVMKKKIFVSIPGVDVDSLSPGDAKELYASLLAKKMKGKRGS